MLSIALDATTNPTILEMKHSKTKTMTTDTGAVAKPELRKEAPLKVPAERKEFGVDITNTYQS